MKDLSTEQHEHPTLMDSDVVEILAHSIGSLEEDYVQFQTEMGKGCGLKMCISGMIHILCNAKYPFDFVALQRKIMLAGGDVLSRCAIVGGLVASRVGAVPFEWEQKTTKYQEYRIMVAGLIELRSRISPAL